MKQQKLPPPSAALFPFQTLSPGCQIVFDVLFFSWGGSGLHPSESKGWWHNSLIRWSHNEKKQRLQWRMIKAQYHGFFFSFISCRPDGGWSCQVTCSFIRRSNHLQFWRLNPPPPPPTLRPPPPPSTPDATIKNSSSFNIFGNTSVASACANLYRNKWITACSVWEVDVRRLCVCVWGVWLGGGGRLTGGK